MKVFKLIVGVLVGNVLVVSAQEFAIKKVEITAETVILHYDLIDTVKTRTYTLSVYSSRDNFLSPLQKVGGDVGLEVRPGQNKRITWRSREELGSFFEGDVELEIRGRLYIPFIRFEGFQDGMVFKRGVPKTVTWTGGTRQNILNLSIYNKDGKFIDAIANVANSNSKELTIPNSVKAGSGYYFLVTDSKNKDQVMKTPTFTVKRKLPLLVKVVPILILGGVIIAVLPKAETKNIDPPPFIPDNPN